jgi:hypothetical protein
MPERTAPIARELAQGELIMTFAEELFKALGARGDRSGSIQSVKIDDRQRGDVYPGFCGMQVTDGDDDGSSVCLEMSPAPYDEQVCKLVNRHGGKFTEDRFGATIRIPIRRKDSRLVCKLAKAVRRVTGRGKRYLDSNWKWVCPRTAASLERFADVLETVRPIGRAMVKELEVLLTAYDSNFNR